MADSPKARFERNHETRYAFGSFELDAASRQLTRSAQPVALAPKTFDLLVVLLKSNGRALTKADLMRELWPDVFVEEANLTFQISTLRKALGAEGAWIETVPKIGYRFNVPAEKEAATAPTLHPAASRRHHVIWAASIGAVVLMLAAVWLNGSRRGPSLSLRPIPLTTYEGVEDSPSFSPDGSQVAFRWNGENQDSSDIYVKTIGSGQPLRLTTGGLSCGPAWSPDGRYIAFVRGREGIFLVPPTGGPDRKLLAEPPRRGAGCQISWSVDAKYLAFSRNATSTEPAGIFVVGVSDGAVRQVTKAGLHEFHLSPAFSPDGRSLAFVSCAEAAYTCVDIAVLPIDAQLNVRGTPQLIANRQSGDIERISWTDDSSGLVFAVNREFRLFHAPLRGGIEPEFLSFAGVGARFPAISKTGHRMTYSKTLDNPEIWRVDDGVLTRSPLSSTFQEAMPQFSSDGKRVVFSSSRSGTNEIWVANADGSAPGQLTYSRRSGTPRWSPDGRWVVYDTEDEHGRWDVSMVEAAGGSPAAVVRHPADDFAPSFSRDGNWIYFGSSRDSRSEIYRVPVKGGNPVRVTDHGGAVGFESFDGKSLYYAKHNDSCGVPLFVRSLAGGAERQVLDSICARSFQVTENGIYYALRSIPDRTLTVYLFDPATGKSTEVRHAKALFRNVTLAASPDGSSFLVCGSVQTGSDLYLVENFRPIP